MPANKKLFVLFVTLSLLAAGCEPATNGPHSSLTAPPTETHPNSEPTRTPIPAQAPLSKPEELKSRCDQNYSGCVPVASDVDCVGGSGNGPAYTGQVSVIGSDIYDLDRDNDGIACE